jgi:hypothetical protein
MLPEDDIGGRARCARSLDGRSALGDERRLTCRGTSDPTEE